MGTSESVFDRVRTEATQEMALSSSQVDRTYHTAGRVYCGVGARQTYGFSR